MSVPLPSNRAAVDTPPIALDAMGGDHAPEEIVNGALLAVREHGLRPVLVGRRPEITTLLAEQGGAGEVPVVHAEETLAMHEGALASWRRPRSSVAVACKLIRRGDASALVSAGSTGGVVATSTVRLRTQAGVLRPGLAVILPTQPTPTVLIDAGANADAKPEMLVQFAHMGAAYAHVAHGVAEPRVGILTIGTEPGKGNKLTRKAAELLAGTPAGPPKLDFHGNIEGHDLLTGAVDVVVTDGFTGNVALKSVEGTARFVFDAVRDSLTSSTLAKAGAMLQRKPLRELRSRFDSESYGGGVLLGLNGSVVTAHGSTHAAGIARACALAHELAGGRITEHIRRRINTSNRAPGWRPRRNHNDEQRSAPVGEE